MYHFIKAFKFNNRKKSEILIFFYIVFWMFSSISKKALNCKGPPPFQRVASHNMNSSQGRKRSIFQREQIFPGFVPGVKCFLLVENSHFGRPKINSSHFKKWKARKKKKNKQTKKLKTKQNRQKTNKQKRSSPHFVTFPPSIFNFPPSLLWFSFFSSPFSIFSLPLFSW